MMRGGGATQLARRQRGLSYWEVLIATGVLAFSLVSALDSLQVAVLSPAQHEASAELQYRLYAAMEELMAESFDLLAAEAVSVGSPSLPSSLSDAPSTPNRRLVYLSFYDGDNADADNDPFTGADPDLLWIRVEIEDTALALQSLTSP